jgi:hypothetical protein
MIFLDKQYQAMVFLKGHLFDTFPVVFVGNLPPPQKKKKPFFCLSLGLCLEACGFLLLSLYLFQVGMAFCEGDSVVKTTKATF